MSKKIEETIVIRNEKMSYAVRLCSKLEGEGSRLENRNPYMVVEDGKIKYLDSLYGNKSEFNFNDEVHAVAKEIFISGLRTAIKEEILRLKQLELVEQSAAVLTVAMKAYEVGKKARIKA